MRLGLEDMTFHVSHEASLLAVYILCVLSWNPYNPEGSISLLFY